MFKRLESQKVEEKLCWGGKGDGSVKHGLRSKIDFIIFVKGGVNQLFREDMLASALFKWKYPPNTDGVDTEYVTAMATLFTFCGCRWQHLSYGIVVSPLKNERLKCMLCTTA